MYKRQSLQSANNEVEFDPYVLLDTFTQAWGKLYNCQLSESYLLEGIFEAATKLRVEMKLPLLRGDMFIKRLAKCKDTSAPGLDGWRANELEPC